MTVLVIDDEADIRLLARVGLTASGFTVVVADGGGQGLRLARDEQPDVILLDVMMPAMDGYATLAALRADPATASIPVLFLTAKAQSHIDPRFAAEPRLGLLPKPFVPRDLATRVREFLGKL
jgi:CheY-like chemotaxis protein